MAVSAGRQLPYGVGRVTPGFSALVAPLLILAAWGAFAYSTQFAEGLVVTGMRDVGTMGGAPWGLYIAFDVYFVGVSFAGITIAALIRLMNLEHLRPVARMAELLTVVALVLAAFTVIADLGQPLRGFINLFLYARPMSPLFGTFTLVISAYLFASLVYLYLDGRRDAALMASRPGGLQGLYRRWAAGYQDTAEERERHHRASWWLSLSIIPLLVIAHSTLGFVFGLQVGRPGWYSALQAPAFVILAGVSGIGHLIVLAALFRWALGLREQLPLRVFTWLGNLLWVLLATYMYFLVVELLTATYTAHPREQAISRALLTGEFAWIFWLSVSFIAVSFLMLFGQFLRQHYSLPLLVLAGVLVNLAAIGKRYLIVVPSLTQGTLLPYEPGSYSPTWVEYSVILGLLSLGALAFVLFAKAFPIMEVSEAEEGGK